MMLGTRPRPIAADAAAGPCPEFVAQVCEELRHLGVPKDAPQRMLRIVYSVHRLRGLMGQPGAPATRWGALCEGMATLSARFPSYPFAFDEMFFRDLPRR
jgi:hypothetical protein